MVCCVDETFRIRTVFCTRFAFELNLLRTEITIHRGSLTSSRVKRRFRAGLEVQPWLMLFDPLDCLCLDLVLELKKAKLRKTGQQLLEEREIERELFGEVFPCRS